MKNSSINKRIKHSFTAIIAICIVFVATFSFSLTVSIYQEKNKESYSETVKYIARNVGWEVSSIIKIMDYIFVDNNVKLLLNEESKTPYQILKERESIDQLINDNILNKSFNYLKEVVIVKNNELTYRFLNGIEKEMLDINKIINTKQFNNTEGSSIIFITDSSNLVLDDISTNYIICIRNIFDSKYATPIAKMIFLFEKDVITRQLYFSNLKGDSGLLLIDSKTNNTIFKTQGESIKYSPSTMVASYPISDTTWTLNGYFSPHIFQKELLLILGSILISIIISIILSRKIWSTLKKEIIVPINNVSSGLDQLSHKPDDLKQLMIIENSREHESEVYHLIENYNLMLSKIDKLIETNINKQVDIEKAEFLALQRQINPHFLYNAIGTIRWMAIMQGNENIKDYSEKLVHLLRRIANVKDRNTINDEIECLKDYIDIQSLAYHYSFKVEYIFSDNWDDIKEVECVRFILQPLVENAIIHGVATKSNEGYLRIQVYSKSSDTSDVIEISIFDNGVGMNKNEIEGNLMSGIGLSNVQKRLKSAYGENFGIRVDSIKGEFTECIVKLPFKKADKN